MRALCLQAQCHRHQQTAHEMHAVKHKPRQLHQRLMQCMWFQACSRAGGQQQVTITQSEIVCPSSRQSIGWHKHSRMDANPMPTLMWWPSDSSLPMNDNSRPSHARGKTNPVNGSSTHVHQHTNDQPTTTNGYHQHAHTSVRPCAETLLHVVCCSHLSYLHYSHSSTGPGLRLCLRPPRPRAL